MNFVFSDSSLDSLRNIIDSDHQIKLIYDDGEVIIVRVLSFESLKKIAGDTSWCIKDSLSYWQDYVGSYNVQIVIVNSALGQTDLKRKIGLTIYSGGRFYTSHNINDSYISESELNIYLGEWTSLNIETLYEMSSNVGSNEYYSSSDVSSDSYRNW